jgi:hypothetical protein
MTIHVADDILGEFARQQNDWFRRVREGSLDPEQVAEVVQQLIDIPACERGMFPKNENGHYTFKITGRNLTGEQEIARMKDKGFRVSGYANQILTSTDDDSYDKNHRLEDGEEYNIVLVPGCEIKKKRTTANIQKYARSFGYEMLLAGAMPRIREVVSDKQMEQMGIWYVACLHTPIKDTDGDLDVLCAYRNDGGRWLNARWGYPGSYWRDDGAFEGAFAFLAPAS